MRDVRFKYHDYRLFIWTADYNSPRPERIVGRRRVGIRRDTRLDLLVGPVREKIPVGTMRRDARRSPSRSGLGMAKAV
jgi:hypothetical protein